MSLVWVENRYPMIKALFDDHYEAFPTWREAGLENLVCLHVDAHLDVMEEGFSPACLAAIRQSKTRAELEQFRDKNAPWGGTFHCGNYLFPALRDGTVSELIWLVPPHVMEGEDLLESVLRELNHWVDLPLDDYSSLRLEGGAVTGTLFGCLFTVCTSQTMPTLTAEQKERLALDIDVDYFVRAKDDVLWQTPHQLAEDLGDLSPVVLTIALSREGGYTPPCDQYLGQVCMDLFSGGRTWKQEVLDLQEADSMAEPHRSERWLELLRTCESVFEPALLARLGRWDEALALNPAYQNRVLDQAARCLEKRTWDAGLKLLEETDDEGMEARQLQLFLRTRSGDFRGARQIFESLISSPNLVGYERIKIYQLGGENFRKIKDFESARKVYQEAVRLSPENASFQYNLALAHKGMGDTKGATRALRKSIRLSAGRLSHLAALAKASSWYQELEQHALAHSARQELKRLDVTGDHVIKVMLKQASRRRSVS